MLIEQKFDEETWDNSGLGFAAGLLQKAAKGVWNKSRGLRYRIRKNVKLKVLKLYTNSWTRLKGKFSSLEIENLSDTELSAIAEFWGGKIKVEGVREVIRDTKIMLFMTMASQRASAVLIQDLEEVAKDPNNPLSDQAKQSLTDYQNGVSTFFDPESGLLASTTGRALLGMSYVYKPLNELLRRLITTNDFGVLFPDLVPDLVWSAVPGYREQFTQSLSSELDSTEAYLQSLLAQTAQAQGQQPQQRAENIELISQKYMRELERERNPLLQINPNLRSIVERSIHDKIFGLCMDLVEHADSQTTPPNSSQPPAQQQQQQQQQAAQAQQQQQQAAQQQATQSVPGSIQNDLGNIARMQQSAEYNQYMNLFLKAITYKTVELYFFIKVLIDRGLVNHEGAFTDLRKFNMFMLRTNMGMMQREYERAKEDWSNRHNRAADEDKAARHRNSGGNG